MSQNYGEVLCQAVDEIVCKRLEGVSYDQTILCTIVDNSKKNTGSYIVSNNNSVKFEAFSNNTSYNNNDNVYVQIPGGDWNQQKTIIAKKTNKNEEPFVYKRPFESLVDITGNLIKGKIEPNQTGLLANSENYQSILLWTYNINDSKALIPNTGGEQTAYTRLGIQAGFKSLINPFYIEDTVYNVTNGDYGLKLTITALSADKTLSSPKEKDEDGNDIVVKDQPATYVLYLNCADMNGNPYDFQSYYTQEKVFDISQIGKIQTMSLEFYQTPGTFKSAEGKLVPHTDFLDNSLPPNLFTDDAYISLGYDTSEFDSEMVYVYTLNSTTYSRSASPLSSNDKEVQLRWIHQQEDGSFKSITPNDKMDYEIRWYKYELGHASADAYSGVYWKDLSVQVVKNGVSSYEIKDEDWKIHNDASAIADQRHPQFFTTWLIPDTTLQEERIKAIILYNGQPYRSNLLVCENEDEVVNKATVDAVQALSVNCEDNTYGNYRIYGQSGSLLDNAQSSITREWKPMFKSSTGGLDIAPDELVEAESIEWIIPTKKTMIEIDNAFLENAVVSYEDNDDARIHIKRTGIGVKGNDISGCNLQKYRIKSYYSQSYSDNTIQCKIVKDKITYTATKELTFGIAGTSGTDCTFIIDFDNGVSAVSASQSSAVTVTARLYDYENAERPDLLDQRTIKWNWKTSDGQLIYNAIEDSNQCEIVLDKLADDGSNYNILQAEIPWGEENSTLTAYLPIPIRASTQYAYISGTSQVIYNSAGEILDLFANPYIVYDNKGDEVSSVTWSIKNNSSKESKYSPTIAKDVRSGNQYLKPLSFYVENACKEVCAIGKIGDTVVWSQPILIMQNRYPSAMLNQWDGKLVIDEEGGSILAPRIAAGMKDSSDGTFSGVILGNWGNTNSDNSLTSGDTGLYGFDHGEQTYAFKQDGTAFIGKEGVGRISFNKNEPGVIQSGAYDAGQGMSINLANGTINAHQFTLTAGTLNEQGNAVLGGADRTILIDTTADNYPLRIGGNFKVNWSGELEAQNGNFTGVVTATSGSFTGEVIATSGSFYGTVEATEIKANYGTIGGWSVSSSGFYNTDTGACLNPDGTLTMGGLGNYSSYFDPSSGIDIGNGAVAINTDGINIGEGAVVIDASGIALTDSIITLGTSSGDNYMQLDSSGIRIGKGTLATYLDATYGLITKNVNIYSLSGDSYGTSAGSLGYVTANFGDSSLDNGSPGIGITGPGETSFLKITGAHAGMSCSDGYSFVKSGQFQAGISSAEIRMLGDEIKLHYTTGPGVYITSGGDVTIKNNLKIPDTGNIQLGNTKIENNKISLASTTTISDQEIKAPKATLTGDIAAANATLTGAITAVGATLSGDVNITNLKVTGTTTGVYAILA